MANRVLSTRDPAVRADLRQVLEHVGFEVIPFKKTREAVLSHLPTSVPLTVTASPAKGQDATVDLAVALAGDGYAVSPHLSARQVRDRAHLADIVERCREAGITGVFVVGGDPTDEPTEFRHAHDLLVALHEMDHAFTDIGIGGHPEGHPEVSDEVLFQALADKAPLATHITTQIVFDPQAIVSWARELKRRGIDLPVHIGVPGAVHRQKLLRVSGGLGIGESGKFLTEAAEHVLALLRARWLSAGQDHQRSGAAPAASRTTPSPASTSSPSTTSARPRRGASGPCSSSRAPASASGSGSDHDQSTYVHHGAAAPRQPPHQATTSTTAGC